MRYLIGFALIALAGWGFVRLTAMREARAEMDRLARYREASR